MSGARLRRGLLGYLAVVGVLCHVAGLFGAAAVLGLWRIPLHRAAKAYLVAGSEDMQGHFPLVALRPAISRWTGWGASPDRGPALDPAGAGRQLSAESVADLDLAISNARPGDWITVEPGIYVLQDDRFGIYHPGTAEQPIVVRAARLGEALILVQSTEGFLVNSPYWVFENLDIQGVCGSHDECEHAFHVVGTARGTVIRNNVIRDFNAAIKGNGLGEGAERRHPDDVVVEGNTIVNGSPRLTDNPVTPIDVVGADGWVVRDNLIADFIKAEGDRVSYAAFFKGNSHRGVMERNLVICSMNLHDPQAVQVGLSLGGGGSQGSALCRDGTCIPEHTGGVIRNNIVLHCSDDGVYLNRAAGTAVYHNTLFDTYGIEARFPESSASVKNNLLSGVSSSREGAELSMSGNLLLPLEELRGLFAGVTSGDLRLRDGARIVDRGEAGLEVADDFCGTARDAQAPDIGAIEYSAGTSCDPAGDN